MTPEQQIAEVGHLRHGLNRNGFRPVPCLTGDKIPLGNKWQERARQNPPECLKWDPVAHALNTGFLCDGLRLFDFDIEEAGVATTAVDLVMQRLGEAPMRFRGNSPRCCLMYRAADGEPPKRSIVGSKGKIEVLGRGQQCLAFGRHPSGAELEWTVNPASQITLIDLPVVTEDQISVLLEELATLIGATPPAKINGADADHVAGDPQAEIGRIAEVMARIPNDGPAAWEAWNHVGLCLWAASSGSEEGRLLWHEWSRKNASYDAKETERRWWHYRTSPPERLGAGSLFHMAQEALQAHLEGFLDLGVGAEAEASTAASEPPELADPWARTARSQPVQPDDPDDSVHEDDWPDPMESAAFHGLLGEVVLAIAPHTEADPHGLLLNLLARFGNKIGRGPHYFVEETEHATNLFVLLAGATSRARKDTSANRIQALFAADPHDAWLQNCCHAGGLSSGEGVIHLVRDEVWGIDKKTGDPVLHDTGVKDKRLLIVESEFASVLAVMRRDSSTLSAILRSGWDRGNLRNSTKNNPERATGVLLSIIGHITVPELRAGLDRTAISNGLMNRFLFALVHRTQSLPFGGNPDVSALRYLGTRLDEAIRAARLLTRVPMAPQAASLWEARYAALTTDQPGLFGSLVARAEAHVVRLAMLYALADQAQVIELPHLQAAFAVWKFSEDSARVLFGSLVGDPIADSLLVFLRSAGNAGMTRTELFNAMGRTISSARIQLAMQLLLKQGRTRSTKGGRSSQSGPFVQRWFYVRGKAP